MMTRLDKDRLQLPQVTLCAVTSVNVQATVRALKTCLGQIRFGDCVLLTDAGVTPDHAEITVRPINRITSSLAYSDFILTRLADHVHTTHCLIAQWDGHVHDAGRWDPAFLDYDYIGASWPQFSDGRDVGNGGFSLRSRRLMEACRAPGFQSSHPEDLAVCRHNRTWLEEQGMRFAPRELADRFAAERAGDPRQSFGYHGVFNMPQVLGVDNFWTVYGEMDDWGTVRTDFNSILHDVSRGPGGAGRAARLIADRLRYAVRRRAAG